MRAPAQVMKTVRSKLLHLVQAEHLREKKLKITEYMHQMRANQVMAPYRKKKGAGGEVGSLPLPFSEGTARRRRRRV